MRLLPALAPALALAAVLAAPAVAQAQSARPVTKDALTRLIKEGNVWCAGWREGDQSCEEIIFVEAQGDKVTQTRRYLIADTADFEMVVRQTLAFEGPRLCWTFKFAAMDVAVLSEGDRAPAAQSAITISLIREKLTDLEGKQTCESYSRDAATGEVSSTATVNGERAPEFDNRFKLLPPTTKVKLRPLFEDTEEATTT